MPSVVSVGAGLIEISWSRRRGVLTRKMDLVHAGLGDPGVDAVDGDNVLVVAAAR